MDRALPSGLTARRLDEVSLRTLATMAWPILVPMLSQNLRILVDTALVGRLGAEALAAQGVAAYLAIVLFAPLTALGRPVQALTARRRAEACDPHRILRAAAGLSLVGGGLYAILLFAALGPLLALLTWDPAVQARAGAYLAPVIWSAPAVGLSGAFYGHWLGTGKTHVSLVIEVAVQVANVALAAVLIYGLAGAPALGVAGAGIALAASSGLGACLHLAAHPRARAILTPGTWWPAVAAEPMFLSQALHSLRLNLQNTLGLFSLYLCAQSLGVAALAAFTVLIRLSTTVIYPAQAIGSAAATLVARSIGDGDPDRARAWARLAIRTGLVITAALGIPITFFADIVLEAVTGSRALADVALWPLRVLGVTVILSGVGFLLAAMLGGAGGADRVRRANFVAQWLVLLPAAAVAGPVLQLGLLPLWLCQSGGRGLAALLLWREWRRWGRTDYRLAER